MIDAKKVFEKVFKTYEYFCRNEEERIIYLRGHGKLTNKTFYCKKIKGYIPNEKCEKYHCPYTLRRRI